jgi:hypothetical protein
VAFRTTALALNVEPGAIAAFDDTVVPVMPATGELNFRVTAWQLNQDFSIEISGRTTTDSMYDLVAGPKPADVEPSALPVEDQFAPGNWSFVASTNGDGKLRLSRFTCRNNPASVHWNWPPSPSTPVPHSRTWTAR